MTIAPIVYFKFIIVLFIASLFLTEGMFSHINMVAFVSFVANDPCVPLLLCMDSSGLHTTYGLILYSSVSPLESDEEVQTVALQC